jgi:hypothetical protein
MLRSVARRPKLRSRGWTYWKPALLWKDGLRLWKMRLVSDRELSKPKERSPPVGKSWDNPRFNCCCLKADASRDEAVACWLSA